MRTIIVCIAATAALAACSKGKDEAGRETAAGANAGGAAGQMAADLDRPFRKPGLWESTMTMTMAGAQTPPGMAMPAITTQVCLDEATAKDGSWMTSNAPAEDQASQDVCQPKVTRIAGGYAFQAECRQDGGVQTMAGTVTGDFQSNYKMDMTMKTQGGPAGASEGKMTVAARYLGPCRPGQQPGVVSMSGLPGAGG